MWAGGTEGDATCKLRSAVWHLRPRAGKTWGREKRRMSSEGQERRKGDMGVFQSNPKGEHKVWGRQGIPVHIASPSQREKD